MSATDRETVERVRRWLSSHKEREISTADLRRVCTLAAAALHKERDISTADLRRVCMSRLQVTAALSATPLTDAMDNVLAWKLGEAANAAVKEPAGDLIDRGLALLRLLNEAGFDVVVKPCS